MTRYADPHRCPDCGAAITPGAPSCAVCALRLQGETAQRLFTTLTDADRLLAELRAASVATVAAVPGPLPALPAAATAAPPHRERRGLGAASVPRILLGLGAVCLLVAAVVFLAVRWSALGVGGRTATLVALTAVAATLAGWLARRALRTAAEAMALVGYGLLTLDLLGANHAGWLGDLGTSGLLAVVGTALALTGTAGTLAVRRSTGTGLRGAELVGALGVGLVVLATDTADGLPVPVALVLGTVLAVLGTLAARLLRLSAATIACVVVAALAWLALTGYALARVADHATWTELWLRGDVVPLLLAAGFVGSLALLRPLPLAARVGGGAVAHALVAVGLLAPAADLPATPLTLVALGVLVLTSAATVMLPRPWGLVDALTQAAAGLGVLLAGGLLAAGAADRFSATVTPVWSGAARDLLPPVGSMPVAQAPAPRLLPLLLLAVVGWAWSLAAVEPQLARALAPLADLRLGAAALATVLVATLVLYPAPVWLVVVALLLVATGFAVWWLATQDLLTLVLAAGAGAVALAGALHAEALTAAALLVLLALTAVVAMRARAVLVAAVAGSLLSAALAATTWTWGSLLDRPAPWVSLTGLLLLAVLVLAAPYAPDRWWAAPSASEARTGAETGAAAAGSVLALAGAVLAGDHASWAAVYLTVGGAALSTMSLLRADRRPVGWAGGLLLAAATWVRLWQLGVHAPEAYTLPSALVLLAAGVLHLRRDASARTAAALTPGLVLAVLPSLLWVLAEPTGLRALLLGLGCLGLVLAGVALRWSAPLAVGAAAGALLVLRLSAPYVGDAVPRWVLIGAAGALLVVVGATWERRLAEARHLVGYVRDLR